MDEAKEGSGCEARGGLSDIGEGQNVTLRNADGQLVATATMGPGTVPKDGAISDSDIKSLNVAFACRFGFKLTDIPDSDFYELEVGRRGKQTYSRAQLEEREWKVELAVNGT